MSEQREAFHALPGVKTELEAIIREPDRSGGILNGKIELNSQFQKQKFFSTVRGGSFPVVHIASHYGFVSDKNGGIVSARRRRASDVCRNEGESKICMVRSMLTLSACDTGVSGNGKEAEGFAYLAQSLGAKSVIASLVESLGRGNSGIDDPFLPASRRTFRNVKGRGFSSGAVISARRREVEG